MAQSPCLKNSSAALVLRGKPNDYSMNRPELDRDEIFVYQMEQAPIRQSRALGLSRNDRLADWSRTQSKPATTSRVGARSPSESLPSTFSTQRPRMGVMPITYSEANHQVVATGIWSGSVWPRGNLNEDSMVWIRKDVWNDSAAIGLEIHVTGKASGEMRRIKECKRRANRSFPIHCRPSRWRYNLFIILYLVGTSPREKRLEPGHL
jgi:hypothetical protein